MILNSTKSIKKDVKNKKMKILFATIAMALMAMSVRSESILLKGSPPGMDEDQCFKSYGGYLPVGNGKFLYQAYMEATSRAGEETGGTLAQRRTRLQFVRRIVHGTRTLRRGQGHESHDKPLQLEQGSEHDLRGATCWSRIFLPFGNDSTIPSLRAIRSRSTRTILQGSSES